MKGTFDLNNGRVSLPPRTGDLTRIVTTRSHMTDIVRRDLTSIPNSTMIQAGGAGYKFLTILDGKADVYVYPRDGTKRWDTCAPEALLRALNGTMVDIFGNEYSYATNQLNIFENCYGLLASSSLDNSHLLSHLSAELKSQVLEDAEKLKAKKEAARNAPQ
jgi:3'(2'), 5'-bisphosphate nucleotidase